VAEHDTNAADNVVEEALRAWRMAQAKRKRVPAFRIFSDKVLRALAESKPQSLADLLTIPGVGVRLAEKYGADLLRVLGGH
jgi:superfamily II DNA helicase RecQ